MRSILLWQAALLLILSPINCQYILQKDYFQSGFFDSFDFFEGPDPTNGFVQYTGRNESLINSTLTTAEMRVSTDQLTPNGRPSIRITSKESYETGLIILDLDHMPGGICGTWPAFWTVGPNWPDDGEIDIIEGVNDAQTNQVTLHTGSTCSISASSMTGSISTDNCDVSNGDNTGCGVTTTDRGTYGSTFNNNGGGVYATLLTQTSGIVVWFWSRDSVPSDVLSGSPEPSTWSIPLANFSGSCDFGNAFTAQHLVFDTTFCGDWAGAVWSQGGCAAQAATCEDYVASNGADFSEAYWSVSGLKVYQAHSGPQSSASTPAPPISVSAPVTGPQPTSDPASSTTPTSSVLNVHPKSPTGFSTSNTLATVARLPTASLATSMTTFTTSVITTSPLPYMSTPVASATSKDRLWWLGGHQLGTERDNAWL